MIKRYDKYKQTGIEWINDIPEHWEIKRIKDIFNLVRGKFSHRPRNDERMYDNGTYPFIQTGDVAKASKYITTYKQVLNENGIKVSKEFKKGTMLMTIAANIGDVAILGYDAYLPDSLVAFYSKHDIDFYYYLLSVTKNELDTVKITNTQDNLNLERLNTIFKVCPPIDEQREIAQYLDNKTKAIDDKVNLLSKKADYYKELRKSIINDAVCKGLDKNIKLKESGISYINYVPVHWKIERIKDQFYIGRGRVIGQEALVENGKYPVYSSQTENNGCLGFISTYDFDKDLLTWTTDGANAGTVFRRKGKFNCTNVCGTLIPKKKNLDLNYVVYALQESATHNKRIDTNGAKIMNNEMALIHIAFPPLDEQIAIANYLDEKTQKIDAIVSNIGKQIETLKELRKTLINDVVTGKIKVTNN